MIKKALNISLKLIALPILLTLIKCSSLRTQKIEVDYEAFDYVEQFQSEAKLAGIDPSIINDSVDMVVFYPLHPSIYGLYANRNRQIILNSSIAEDTVLLKKVIYHELGHLYGLEHDKGGIMRTDMATSSIHDLYCTTENAYGNFNWDMHKAFLFYKIRRHLEYLEKSK